MSNKDYKDFQLELKKQEKAFEEPSKRGLPRRFYITPRAMAIIWLTVATFLGACTLFFIGYELLNHEGLWTVILVFAFAALISVGNGRRYREKSSETPTTEEDVSDGEA